MMLISYVIVFSLISGLVLTKPVEEKPKSQYDLYDQAFREAEIILHRYYYLMDSDTDQLVHALLHIIMNNPTTFPFIPPRALEIALNNLEQKLGHNNVDTLTKPILLSIEQNAQNKSEQLSSVQLTDEVKEKIEDALDKFFEDRV